jgi:hypothetical protein
MDAHMQATFDRKLPEIRFDDVSFADVIEFLRDLTGANIFVNWRALESVGIDRNSPVTMRMKNVSFATVLRLLLDSTAPNLLHYDVDGGVIIITAAPDAQNAIAPVVPQHNPAPVQSITKVYDIRDLLAAAKAAADANTVPADPVLSDLRRQRAQLLETHGSEHVAIRELDARIRGTEKHLASTNPRDSGMSDLVNIVQETIGRDQPLSVRGFNTKLVVRAALDVQREVEQLLAMLREDNAPAPARSTATPAK